jgi:hypothetical protein
MPVTILMMFFRVKSTCGLSLGANISEKRAVSIFRAEVKVKVKVKFQPRHKQTRASISTNYLKN